MSSDTPAEAQSTGTTLSVICPCYNEAEVTPRFYAALKSALDSIESLSYEIIFVDDGSTDETLSVLNGLGKSDGSVAVCSLSRNFGHQIALSAGLDFARGDAVVMMDSDLQHPPELVPKFVEKWREGYDVVSAIRKDVKLSLFKKITAKAFYFLINHLSPTYVEPNAADFCLLSRKVYAPLRNMRERHRFLRGMVSWVGFNRTFLHYDVGTRAAGQTKYTVAKMTAMAFDAIFSFSSAPLRLATRSGFLITVLGTIYLVWIVVRYFVVGDAAPGWASLIGVTLILGGTNLLFLGLVGEYLARVFEEVKGRPLYLIKQPPTRAGQQEPQDQPSGAADR